MDYMNWQSDAKCVLRGIWSDDKFDIDQYVLACLLSFWELDKLDWWLTEKQNKKLDTYLQTHTSFINVAITGTNIKSPRIH